MAAKNIVYPELQAATEITEMVDLMLAETRKAAASLVCAGFREAVDLMPAQVRDAENVLAYVLPCRFRFNPNIF